MPIYIKHLHVVDSTNRYARDEASALWNAAGDCGVVVVTAEHQTAGRGQRGNSWLSQSGCNLLLSILVRPGNMLAVSRQFLLSQTVAVAVHAAMKCYGIDTRLKWPNDIYVDGRKLAGILVELDYSGSFVEQAIIGVGLNVNQTEFLPMERVPVSMKMLLGKDYSVDDVLGKLLGSFEHYYTVMCSGNDTAIVSEYNRLLLGIGEKRTYIDSNGAFDAVMEGVEPCGNLLLRLDDGTLRKYAFKEVEMQL